MILRLMSVLILTSVLSSCSSQRDPLPPPDPIVITKTETRVPQIPEYYKTPCSSPMRDVGTKISIEKAIKLAPQLQKELCECSNKLAGVLLLLGIEIDDCTSMRNELQ